MVTPDTLSDRHSWQAAIDSPSRILIHHAMQTQPDPQPDQRAAATHIGLKLFGYFVLLLMAVMIIYTFYIVVLNWSHIGV